MAPRRADNIRLDEACRLYLQRIDNHAPTTIRTAKYGLERFQRWLKDTREPNPYLHLIDVSILDSYCYGPKGLRRDVSAAAFNGYRSVLKVFFDYALMMRWVDRNPIEAIPKARPDAPTQKLMLTAGELLALLEHAANPIERVTLALGMNTGLRANDLRHVTVFDASLSGGVIQTEIRKTRKLDIKPITMELHRELVMWLDTYAHLMGLESRGDLPNEWLLVPAYDFIWARENGQRVRAVRPRPTDPLTHPYRLIQRPLQRMGYPTRGEGVHTLRRSSARALFESLRSFGEGRDHALMIVKEFLNHSSVVQTERYLGLNQERTIRDSLLKDRPFLTQVAESEQSRVRSDDDQRGIKEWRAK